MQSIEFVVINLKERSDRLTTFLAQFSDTGIQPSRIDAISGKEIEDLGYVTKNVAACWQSHLKAYQHLQTTDKKYLVVFEDDAILTHEGLKFLTKLNESQLIGIDLLQFGYLTHRKKLDLPRYDSVFAPILFCEKYLGKTLSEFDLIFRFWVRFTRFILRKYPDNLSYRRHSFQYFKSEYKLRKKLGSAYPLIYHSFEPGTHAYIVSRDFANFLTMTNLPTFLAADLHLMGVAASGNLRSIRISKSLCNQSDSPSSINERENQSESLIS